jgi:hypothetical protein
MRFLLIACLFSMSLTARATAAGDIGADAEAAKRAVRVDHGGVVRWTDSGKEVALYGANYCIMSGSDYRMAGLVSHDRKAMIDEDMAQFARLGWQALRLCSWGDWENADAAGNLIVNEHVDLLDYLIAAARQRGIYLLLTPIHTYDPAFADQTDKPSNNSGFSRYTPRTQMGTDAKSIAAQVNYIGQLLNHVNPYTRVAIKNEAAIPFVEMINEPVHHPENLNGSVDYINALVRAVRDTGSRQITFFNVSQDFAIAPAIRLSKVDGVSFGWYPTSLVAGHALRGNFLPAVDAYPDMLRPDLARRPRIVYEFDQADLVSGYLYPAMARTFRSVGTQFATMFAYDMLQTAPYNLGWQTHFLNLVHTPRKAVSAVIAAEAMRRLPRMKSYGRYPDSVTFGDFRVSYEGDMSELNADDAFMNAGATPSSPRNFKALQRIVGFGSSGVVSYEGSGAYFLDKVHDGLWRLEVYPDEVLVRDPFEQPRPDKVVSRLLYRRWPMRLVLPDLGSRFSVTPIKVPNEEGAAVLRAENGAFPVQPGVWLLSRSDSVDRSKLPPRINRVGFGEYHVNDPVAYPDLILSLTPEEFVAGSPVEIRVRVANATLPDEVKLWVRAAGMRAYGTPVVMTRLEGNDYHAMLAPDSKPEGIYEFVVSAKTGQHVDTFPGSVPQQPGSWPFQVDAPWTFRVTPRGAALRLLNPRQDYARLSFVRPGEQYRTPFFQIVPAESSDEAALCLTLPDLGKDTPERYAASLFIGDAITGRGSAVARGTSLDVRLRAVGGARKTVELTLIEQDGAAWSIPIVATGSWTTHMIALDSLRSSRSIHIPSPYPGLWDYWRTSPASRGSGADHIRIDNVERLQLTVYPNTGDHVEDDGGGAAVESIRLNFPQGD